MENQTKQTFNSITENKLPKVQKRNGNLIEFEQSKIFSALQKAASATGEITLPQVEALTKQIVANCKGKEVIAVEEIQNQVENTLIENSFYKTMRSFAVYREKHKQLREDRKALIDAVSSINEYLNRSDWRVNANANQNYSVGGLILNIAGKTVANYWLNHVYANEIKDAHIHGAFHIHDLDMLTGYCAGWSLKNLLYEGFNGCPGKVESEPPKHFRTALGQAINFLGTLQNEWAGAQAFSSFDTYLAPYLRIDHLSYEDVYQGIQEFVYNLNVPSRWGSQPPFTNLTFDLTCPDDLKNKKPLIGGEEADFTYGDLQHEMDMINKAYIEVMLKGDAKGRVFTFPIPTYNVTKDFNWEHPNTELLFEMTGKYGLPYFQNFINSDLDPHMIRSMCCRLQLDLTELLKRGNGLFGSAEQTGSIGVVTINCARLGYLHKGNLQDLLNELTHLAMLAKESLEIKRKVIQRFMDDGLFPYTKRYLGTLRNHFSTLGINGINECISNFTNGQEDITTKYGHSMALTILDKMRDLMVNFQEETGHLYNLEASPAEGATYRFAKEDKTRFPNIIQAGTEEAPYYTNSSQLPVDFTDDAFEGLVHQEPLQGKYTGGTVFHMYIPEAITDPHACKELVRRTLTRFKIPYLTITPTFSICPTHGYLHGEHHECPKCGLASEVWTRVMGYHRPVSSFNKGKRSEFNERVSFETYKVSS
jgi:anaerobic ribonucleoside-triphosphate reductase